MATVDQKDAALCGLSWASKVVCSGVHITGRDARDVFFESCCWMSASDAAMLDALGSGNPQALLEQPVEIDIDTQHQAVGLHLDGRTAWSRFNNGQGCAVSAAPDAKPFFQPTPVPINVGEPDSTPWPQGDLIDAEPDATGIDVAQVNTAIDLAFANPLQYTNAMVVLHRGELVAERYREPFDRSTQFESWSMGKSIAATLVGVAEQRGIVALDEPAGFDAWSGSEDPRAAIKVRDILNMASGLSFSGSYGPQGDLTKQAADGSFLDHIYVYAGGCDSFHFCLDKPLADEPGTAGRYRNCDPILATALVRERTVGDDVQAFLTWPQANLFDRLGMGSMVLETDPYGHFLISGHDYGCARDWARLGLLYAQRGAWGGEQVLSPGFVDFVQTPASHAWSEPNYGGFFYTNAGGQIPGLPADAYFMSGGGSQRVVVIPSLDLVIVRLGHIGGLAFGVRDTLNEAFGMIARAAA
ncbi:MAG: serine hydrolase [Pseudomonadota bacterium]